MGLGATGPRPRHGRPLRLLVLAAATAACTAPPPEDVTTGPVVGPSAAATPPAVLRIATTFPSSLDPRDADDPESLLLASHIFDGLVTYDPLTTDVLPAAAERWEAEDGGGRFVFHLRPGMTFHDGSPVRAHDFVLAWNRLADPVAPTPYSFLLEQVEGYQRYQQEARVSGLSGLEALDDATLQVTLVRPWRDFVSLLGHPALSPVPPTANSETFPTQPVGNGPYRVAAPLTVGSPLVLQRFDTYYGTPPTIPSIELRPFEEPGEAWPEFVAGELDIAPVPAPLLTEAQGTYGEEGTGILARLLYCGFNEQDERFANADLRRAASLAIGRDAIAAEVYGGLAVPAPVVVPPTIPGHRPDLCAGRCQHDPDPARAIVSRLDGASRAFSLDYPGSAVADRVAQTLVAQLEDVGFQVTPRPHDTAGFEELLERGLHEMFCLAWVADYPRQQAFLEPLLESTSQDNHAGVADEDLDRLLERARADGSVETRREIYAEAERLALERMHVIPVVWFRGHLAAQPQVEGFVVDPMGRYDAVALRFGPPA